MKTRPGKLFWFVLRFFEKGDEPYKYKPLNRKILVVAGFLFIVLSMISGYFSMSIGGYGYLIPVIVFFTIGFISITVGIFGSDRAVSNIWGNR
jgi:hypothetical protein